ncbi:MAG: hypothetical protein IJZ16_13590 [Clostridia bacterium]|nr:hypothetical protein [Clostridia bacterium]
MKNKKFIGESWFYTYFKKHYCPKCGAKLKVQKVSKIVNSNSPEAKEYDFSLGDTFLMGDVEFFYNVFSCSTCSTQYSVKEMKKLEK